MPTPPPIYTEEMYLALGAAIAQGALEVRYGDKTVRYRSLSEMKNILSMMTEALYPKTVDPNRKYASFSKGTTPRRGRYDGFGCGEY